jgi:hypothetical protein
MGGSDETSVLVGFEGGRIARLDAASFTAETVATVPGSPLYVARSRSGEPVVVYGRPEPAQPLFSEQYEDYRIWLGPTGRDVPLAMPAIQPRGRPANAFLLDSAYRLWLGVDRGEWGGALEVVDLKTGAVRILPKDDWGGDGVYGIVESSPGVVLAFGGTSHLGYLESFVAKAAPDPVSRLYRYGGMPPILNGAKRRRWMEAPEPRAPLTHVLRRADGTFWALSYGRLIETDARFRTFRRIHDFSLHYTPGRPDAVGSYPAVVSAMLDGARLLLATRNDGLIEYSDGRAIAHALPDQIAAETDACVPTPAGMLFLTHFGGSLRTNVGDWKDVAFQFTGQDDKPLSEPEELAGDPDIQVVRNAVEAWISRRRSERSDPGMYARTEWDERTDLVATEHGLCLQAHGSGACPEFTIPGVDDVVTSFARDSTGRLWLAGRGLWIMNAGGPAVAIHAQLPFLTDTVIREILLVDGKLVLSLGDRGAAVIDARTVATDDRRPDHPTVQ